MRRLLCVLLLGACVAGLAACGGSGALTATQYVAKVDGLCLAQAKAARQIHLTLAMADWRRDGPKIVHLGERFTSAISALKPPPTLTTLAQAYLAANEQVLAADRAAVAAARAGDRTNFRGALRNGSQDFSNASSFAQQFGATDC